MSIPHDNDPDSDVNDATDRQIEVPFDEATSKLALFEGDEGGLDLDQRRALVAVMKQRFITASSHPKEWATIRAAPIPICRALNNVFLDLVLDVEREVAYKRQAVPETGFRPFPTLLHDIAWQREETILLVYLRTRFRAEQSAGNSRMRVHLADMLQYVRDLRPDSATDQVADERRARRAVDTMQRTGLIETAGDDEQFEVSAAIEVMLPIHKLRNLLEWIQHRTHEPASPADQSRGLETT